jgi:hypothetical protein
MSLYLGSREFRFETLTDRRSFVNDGRYPVISVAIKATKF